MAEIVADCLSVILACGIDGDDMAYHQDNDSQHQKNGENFPPDPESKPTFTLQHTPSSITAILHGTDGSGKVLVALKGGIVQGLQLGPWYYWLRPFLQFIFTFWALFVFGFDLGKEQLSDLLPSARARFQVAPVEQK